MKKILAFFGAFNPPTVAHLTLAKCALDRSDAEFVMFVPSKSAYISGVQHKDFAYSDSERLEMLSAAALTRPWMLVSDIEIKGEKQPRTYETLKALREQGYLPKLLVGSDKLPEFERGWRNVDAIAKEFGIVCLCRGDDNCECMLRDDKYLSLISPYISVVSTPESLHYVSSSAVRKKLAGGKLSADVPTEILPLLKEKKNEA